MLTLLTATALFRMTQNMALTTLSLLARDEVHLSSTVIGLTSALSALVLSAVTIFVAGRVPLARSEGSAAAGALLLLASLTAFALASSLAVLAVAALLLGAAGGLALPGLVSAVEARAGDNHERAIGLYTLALSASLALGPVLESSVLDAARQDVRAPFAWFIPLAGATAAILVLPRPRAGRFPRPPAAPAPARPAPADGSTPGRRPRAAPGGLLGSPQVRQALIIDLLYAIPFAGLTSFGALVFRAGYGVSAAQAQVAFAAFFVTSFGARALLAWRSPVTRKQPLLWTSAALTAGGLALLGTGHGTGLLLIAMAVLGIPHGLTFPLALALIAGATDRDQLPRANGALLGASNLSTIAVPSLLGAVIPATGYQNMTLLLDAPVLLFSLLLLIQQAKTPRKAHAPAGGGDREGGGAA